MNNSQQLKPCADGNGTARPHYWFWNWGTNKSVWPDTLKCSTCGAVKQAEDVARRVIG